MKIMAKILMLSMGGTAVTAAVLIGMVQFLKGALDRDLTQELNIQARQQCAAIAMTVHHMLEIEDYEINKKTTRNLNVASHFLARTGKIAYSNESVVWNISNQLTKETSEMRLPKMMAGESWLEMNRDFEKPSPVVDKVASLIGGTCTIFQRINDSGDMLRVCTNVKDQDGKRAVGTYIPAVLPDGSPDPVISALLQGKPYTGLARSVTGAYIRAYSPLTDESGRVVGAISVGLNQEDNPQLRQVIMDIVVGKTGYVYILDGSNDHKGRYIISQKGKRDGENIWDMKDAGGRLFIQSIVQKALAVKNGKCDVVRYPWKNQDDPEPRNKLAAVTYFQPWNWIIAASAYEDDFQNARKRLSASLNGFLYWSLVASVTILIMVGIITILSAVKIVRPISAVAEGLKDIAQGDGDLTKRLPEDTKNEIGELTHWFNTFQDKLQVIIKRITDNAKSLADSSTELSATASQLAGGTDETTKQSSTVASAAGKKLSNMNNMDAATKQMTASISETAKNAEQASSVAENAAAMANSSKELAKQTAEAAKDIRGKIEGIQSSTGLAVKSIGSISEVIQQVNEISRTIASAMEEQSVTTKEIAQNVSQTSSAAETVSLGVTQSAAASKEVTQNIAGVDQAAKQTAQGAVQTQTAGAELSKLAKDMQSLVG